MSHHSRRIGSRANPRTSPNYLKEFVEGKRSVVSSAVILNGNQNDDEDKHLHEENHRTFKDVNPLIICHSPYQEP